MEDDRHMRAGEFGEVDEALGHETLMSDGEVRAVTVFPKAGAVSPKDMAGAEGDQIALLPRQTHSLDVVVAEEHPDWMRGGMKPEADAVVTFRKGMAVGVRTADCVPVMVYARDVKGVAAVHAGWRGTLGGILDNALDVLEAHGAKPEELFVAFGPSISVGAYEVDRELAERFVEAGFGSCVTYPDGEHQKPHIDLQGVNVERLLRRGVPEEQIRRHAGCTVGFLEPSGRPLYQSHRRSGGAPGRMVTYIALQSDSG